MKILADATLPNLSALFSEPFTLTLYNTPGEIIDLLPTHDILLCRSTLRVTDTLLRNSPIQCVATASSGIDHIDQNYLKKHNIALFDAKGCNAPAVADYVISTIAFLYCKSKLMGHKAGVIGVGEVGSRVVKRLRAAGFDVICFDPLKTPLDKRFNYGSLDELTKCDVLCVHANLHETTPHPSANLIGADFLARLKPGTVIINAARGGIINENALLTLSTPLTYCTDVYTSEPAIQAEVVNYSTICTPHIAGHSIEAKKSAVVKLSQQLYEYYGLSIPASPDLEKGPMLSPNGTWQECVLSLYNPITDTFILKSAADKKTAFLTQRQAHQNRHDFTFYEANHLKKQLKELLGQ
jgi:erythronate-4-phosphate dehydrogenase